MAKMKKPNILFIMSDDIGWFNVSCYNHGIMGYRTPNIDRIAQEGAMFTDFYAQQSCTAGRAAFVTGQQPIRTGMTKVGMPGATLGLEAEDPTSRKRSCTNGSKASRNSRRARRPRTSPSTRSCSS
jgi:arylsulfatase A-like enzyme